MSTRRDAREHVIGLLYEADIRALDADGVLASLPVAADSYTEAVVRGVAEHVVDIDALLEKYAQRWSVDRMPAVDRAILRMAVFELGWQMDVPRNVILSEAVELAKSYSTKDSGRFVNGVLGSIADEIRGADEV
jgi:N utilization substance protein B